jgi:uncharacterized protein (TIGR02145 family)
MAENLRTTKYNDGSAIPLVTDSAAWCRIYDSSLTTPAYCYYKNTTNSDSIKKFGALYNWYIVSPANFKKIAPTGWHVPTYDDWIELERYLIANGYNWDGTTGTTTGNKIAKSMAAKTDWVESIGPGAIGNDLSTNNRSGFSALPGGFRDSDGSFYDQSHSGSWWSAMEDGAADACTRHLYYANGYLYGGSYAKSYGFSVRLIRDN